MVKLDLVGVAEVAEMLGVSRQRVHAIAATHPEFPEPVAELSAGKIWLRKDIAGWARHTGRELGGGE
jgi:predicted DNA-binding transcriptional regulator AlpA